MEPCQLQHPLQNGRRIQPGCSRLPLSLCALSVIGVILGAALWLNAGIASLGAEEKPAEKDSATASEKKSSEKGKSAKPATAEDQEKVFHKQIMPFMRKYCFECHGEKRPQAGIDLHADQSVPALLQNRKMWEKVLDVLELDIMPPEDQDPLPTFEEKQDIAQWLDGVLYAVDCTAEHDPGRVTIRRLNRAEYNNTIRDLIGVDFQPAADFPSDDVGYGFDNIGDVLSLPPLLMEKYLDAAEAIAEAAIVPKDPTQGVTTRFQGRRLRSTAGRRPRNDGFYPLASNGSVYVRRVEFPHTGEYILRARASADQAGPDPARMEFRIDEKAVKVIDVKGQRKPDVYEFRVKVEAGERRFDAAFINDYYMPEHEDPKLRGDRNLYIHWLEVQGPMDLPPDFLPETHRRIITCRPDKNRSVKDCAEEIMRQFAGRAFRRPATEEEVARLVQLVEAVVEEGEVFERAIQIGVQAVLVSPSFLFRIEEDRDPHDPQAKHPITDFELATRLSYFLWSSMPDDELFELARQSKLHDEQVLRKQVERMLQDPKSWALVENFASQWLNLRNLDEVSPDPKLFDTFDDVLRADMLKETQLFFEAVMREDRSILDLLDGRFTFLNERLAEHYGLSGVKGEEFQRVDLSDQPRAGVVTQASVLTLTSNPTRTSPVMRGKWILENLLGTPPPPAPENVPDLEETAKSSPDLPLRKQLEIHRTNPVCASCHRQMDALGFGLENFDAIGRWRDKDGKFEIDSSGALPGGDEFDGPTELVQILKKRRVDFTRCFAEKLLTFALGRGLEFYDRCAVDNIVETVENDDHRFSTLVFAIVNSEPFRMRRGEGGTE